MITLNGRFSNDKDNFTVISQINQSNHNEGYMWEVALVKSILQAKTTNLYS